MSTGENIQFLRKREGFTQEGFAEQMGVSRQTISKWESDICFPEMEKMIQMCEMFHCNLDELVRGDVQVEATKDTTGYGKYDIKEYNKENVKDETKEGELKSAVNGCIMLTATIIFMIWSFVFQAWAISWIVFPIGGILCGFVTIILKLALKESNE